MRLKDWVIRIVLGIVLGFGAGAAVEAMHLTFVVVIFGGLDEYLNRKHPREEMQYFVMGLNSMLGGVSATAIASLVAVMVAPTHYTTRLIFRSWAIAATMGGLGGCGIGAMASLMHPRHFELEGTMILTMTCCVPAGAAAAILLRLCVK